MPAAVAPDGTTVGYTVSGSGEPLVLIHGALGSMDDFILVRPHLDPSFEVVVMDRRGRGSSSDAPTHSIAVEAGDVLAVIDAVGAPVHLFGHSFGAVVAMEAAARGAPLRSLILYEPPCGHIPQAAVERVCRRVEEGELEDAVEGFFPVAGITPDESASMKSIPAVWRDVLEGARQLPRELVALQAWSADTEALGALRVPVTSIRGSETVQPVYDEEMLSRLFSGLRRVVVEGQAHAAFVGAPAGLAEAITSATNPVAQSPQATSGG